MSADRMGRRRRSLLAALVPTLWLIGVVLGPRAVAHTHGLGSAAATPSLADVILRDLLLVANTVVAGVALLRPWAGQPTRATRVVTLAAAGLAALADITADVNLVLAALLALATVLVPLLLNRPIAALAAGALLTALLVVEEVFGLSGAILLAGVAHSVAATVLVGCALLAVTGATDGRRALLRRLAPVGGGALLLVAGTGIAQASLAGIDVDQRLLRTTFGLLLVIESAALLLTLVLAVVAWRRSGRFAYQGVLVGLVLATAVGGSFASLPAPAARPVPGTPLLGQVALDGTDLPVLMVPQRPGWNLVHVGDQTEQGSGTPSQNSGVAVGSVSGRMVPLIRRPGASGWWALVDLPAGWGTLWLREAGQRAGLLFDTGDGPGGPRTLNGSDGPECAEALLGGLAAGTRPTVTSCPSDHLDPSDAALLSDTVLFLAKRNWHSITLVGDSSPRSVAAARAVRKACAEVGLAVRTPANPSGPVVIVAGWAGAATALADVAAARLPGAGAYLARWLVTAPLLDFPAGQLVALRYSPNDPLPLRYLTDLDVAFPEETASADGYAAWQSATGDQDTAAPVLYAMSWLTWSPQDFQHGGDSVTWLPHGTITQATGPIPVESRR